MEPTPQPQPESSQPLPQAQRPTSLPRITVQEVEQQCQDLRTLLTATFIALLVLSLSVNLFLAKQMRQIRAKVTETRPVIARMQAEFRKKEPNMKNFVNSLQSFAAANRDFQPILERYRAMLPQYMSSGVPVMSAPAGVSIPANPIPAAQPTPAPRPAGK